ncbi:MAG: twin-arginine translocase TatA/TatE family subunit [Deltaproteobacteria bacterium]|nr:twin-arginine translocase TatA/TatE family subunit [Deltaproteobacteria bacterium]
MPLLGIPSFWELVIIFAVVFLLFGGKKLPELGGAIGESIKNFKKGLKDDEPAKKIADNTPPSNPNDKDQPPQA